MSQFEEQACFLRIRDVGTLRLMAAHMHCLKPVPVVSLTGGNVGHPVRPFYSPISRTTLLTLLQGEVGTHGRLLHVMTGGL